MRTILFINHFVRPCHDHDVVQYGLNPEKGNKPATHPLEWQAHPDHKSGVNNGRCR